MSDATAPLSTVAEPPPWQRARQSWNLQEGDAIAAGLTVLRRLGGGQRYEVFLVWDDHRLAVLVAKVLRPEHVDDPVSLRDLAAEARRAASGCAIRRSSAGSTRCSTGPLPHLLLEHLEGPTLPSCSTPRPARRSSSCSRSRCTSAAALHYVAAEGMVHLDVKPDNIVMGAPPRLIDLSVARTVGPLRGCGQRSGPTRTWRPSSATPHAARSGRPRTCSAWPRRCSTPALGGGRSCARAGSGSRSWCARRRRCRGGRFPGSARCCSPRSRRHRATGRRRGSSRRGWSRWWPVYGGGAAGRPAPRRRRRASPGARRAGTGRRSRSRAPRARRGRTRSRAAARAAMIWPTSAKSSACSAARRERGGADAQAGGDRRRARVERDGVAVDGDADVVQAVLGLLAVELGLAQVDEHEVDVGAAGEHVDAVAGAEQLLGDGLRAVDRALLALAEQLGRRRS